MKRRHEAPQILTPDLPCFFFDFEFGGIWVAMAELRPYGASFRFNVAGGNFDRNVFS